MIRATQCGIQVVLGDIRFKKGWEPPTWTVRLPGDGRTQVVRVVEYGQEPEHHEGRHATSHGERADGHAPAFQHCHCGGGVHGCFEAEAASAVIRWRRRLRRRRRRRRRTRNRNGAVGVVRTATAAKKHARPSSGRRRRWRRSRRRSLGANNDNSGAPGDSPGMALRWRRAPCAAWPHRLFRRATVTVTGVRRQLVVDILRKQNDKWKKNHHIDFEQLSQEQQIQVWDANRTRQWAHNR